VIDALDRLTAELGGYAQTGVLRDDLIGLTLSMSKENEGVKGDAYRSLLGEARRSSPSDSSTTGVSIRPRPVISMRTTSPGSSHRGDGRPAATPAGVPVVTMSPGRRVVVSLSHSMSSAGLVVISLA
jgi:hypothetical protein